MNEEVNNFLDITNDKTNDGFRKCPKCGAKNNFNNTYCYYCGDPLANDKKENDIIDNDFNLVNKTTYDYTPSSKKYPALTTISGFFKFIAGFIGLITFILIMIQLVALGNSSGMMDKAMFLSLFGTILIGGFLILVSVAIAEIIIVLADIEQNTRQYLRNSYTYKIRDDINKKCSKCGKEFSNNYLGDFCEICGTKL